MLISSLTLVCREFNYIHDSRNGRYDKLSTAVPLVLPDSWSNLTQLQSFQYQSFPLAGPVPSSWSKLENIYQISAINSSEYSPSMVPCLPARSLSCHLSSRDAAKTPKL